MKLRARNVFSGKVVEVTKGAVAAELEVDLGNDNVITSAIAVGSAERLGLAPGKDATVVIKASDVIIGVE